MNIFYLDEDPSVAAQSLGDKHVVKMLLESVQLLSGVYYIEGSTKLPPKTIKGEPYKKTHFNHPCAIWARSDMQHWIWLLGHAANLYNEYKHRWPDRDHACVGAISYMTGNPPTWLYNTGFSEPPKCMPEEFKGLDTILSYRQYYSEAKKHLHKWTRRTPPSWLSPKIRLV